MLFWLFIFLAAVGCAIIFVRHFLTKKLRKIGWPTAWVIGSSAFCVGLSFLVLTSYSPINQHVVQETDNLLVLPGTTDKYLGLSFQDGSLFASYVIQANGSTNLTGADQIDNDFSTNGQTTVQFFVFTDTSTAQIREVSYQSNSWLWPWTYNAIQYTEFHVPTSQTLLGYPTK